MSLLQRRQRQLQHAMLLVVCLLFISTIATSTAETERLANSQGRQLYRTTTTEEAESSTNDESVKERDLAYSSSSSRVSHLSVGASAVGMPLQSWQIQARSQDGSYRLDPYVFVEDTRSKAQKLVTAHSSVTRRGPRMDSREELDDIDYQYLRQNGRRDPN